MRTYLVVRSVLIAAAVALLALPPSLARAGQKTTPAETKERMIQLIATLETTPYNESAGDYRREAMAWLTEAPDVTVEMCTYLLGDVKKLGGDDGAILVGQLPLSQARYILEHPEKAKDRLAVSVAGIDGVLRTYVAMKQTKPDLHFESLEKLIQLEADEKLDAFAEQALKKCK